MQVSENILIGTFQCLVDQIHELHKNTDSIRQDLNSFILQQTGILSASCLGIESNIVFDKQFKGFEASHILFSVHEGNVVNSYKNDDIDILTSQSMILLNNGQSLKIRDAVKRVHGMLSKDTKKVTIHSVPPLLIPVLECWMHHGHDSVTYETEMLKLIHHKKNDMAFKIAFSDMEHNHKYIPIPSDLFQKAIEIYWDLG